MKIIILKGKAAEDWKASRRKVVKRRYLGNEIDGIKPGQMSVGFYTAEINPDFLN